MTEQAIPDDPAGEKPEPKLLPIPVFDVVPTDPPRFYVHGDALHATVTGDDGQPQKHVIPLRVKGKHVAEIEDLDTSLEQLHALASLRLDEALPEALDEMDIIDAREVARKFFQAFHEKEEARLGESFGSSAT